MGSKCCRRSFVFGRYSIISSGYSSPISKYRDDQIVAKKELFTSRYISQSHQQERATCTEV